jgi:hypothetical protein
MFPDLLTHEIVGVLTALMERLESQALTRQQHVARVVDQLNVAVERVPIDPLHPGVAPESRANRCVRCDARDTRQYKWSFIAKSAPSLGTKRGDERLES